MSLPEDDHSEGEASGGEGEASGSDEEPVTKKPKKAAAKPKADPKPKAEKKAKVAKVAADKPDKKTKKRKDKNAPKRGLSAYMFFSQAKREQVKTDNPGIVFTDIGRKIAELWRECDDKEEYEDSARKDKVRRCCCSCSSAAALVLLLLGTCMARVCVGPGAANVNYASETASESFCPPVKNKIGRLCRACVSVQSQLLASEHMSARRCIMSCDHTTCATVIAQC